MINIHPGEQFGRYTVTSEPFRGSRGATTVTCKCACGTIKDIYAGDLKSGRVVSCGCKKRDDTIDRNYKHGQSHRTRLYQTWLDMKKRCYIPSTAGYARYGGRGITVCDEWKSSFVAFQDWALANGYTDLLTIDRIDTNGNYEPSNCRFVTHQENMRNRRSNHLLCAFGETKTVTEWTEDVRCVVDFSVLSQRVGKLKWRHEEAITTPLTVHP